MKPVLVSGIQPSGKLHIGNYLGALKNFVALQDSEKYECLFFVADYHSLTESYTPQEKSEQILELCADFLAAGLNPQKSTIFIQSQIPEHTELAWIFNTLTSVGELERMVEYKDKTQRGIMANAGLFDYPVLMAADILIYKAEFVPVGVDQKQHLELTRTIARNFNKKFGQTFPEPKALYTNAPKIMNLNEPDRKMSKSAPQGCLFLSDSVKSIKEKIQRAVTDSKTTVDYEPDKRPGISNLVLIYSELSGFTKEEVVQKFRTVGYAEFKKELTELIIQKLKPFRNAKEELLKDKDSILRIFQQGSRKAKKIAKDTMEEAKRKIGLQLLENSK